MIFQHATIIGLGAIGSSLARCFKSRTIARHITGYSPNPETREKALQLNIIDSAFPTPMEAVHQSDVVILCSPLNALRDNILQIKYFIPPECIITDTGSVKHSLVESIYRTLLPHQAPFFIPGHPIAGSEKTGIDAGSATLFEGATTVLTPTFQTSHTALQRISEMWEACGSKVSYMTSLKHDDIYAKVSHFPQLLAFVYAISLKESSLTLDPTLYPLYQKFTRLCFSSPALWRDIFLMNRMALIPLVEQAVHRLETMPLKALSQKDIEPIHTTLAKYITQPENITPPPGMPVYSTLYPIYLAYITLTLAEGHLPYAGNGLKDFIAPLFMTKSLDSNQLKAATDELQPFLKKALSLLNQCKELLIAGDADKLLAFLDN